MTGSASIFWRRRLIWTSTLRAPSSEPGGASSVRATGWPGTRGKHAEKVPFARGEPDQFARPAQFAARQIECEVAEVHFAAPARLGVAALEQIADAQQQFARLERLGQIVVAAAFEARDAVGRVGQRREHENRHAVVLGAQRSW